MKRVLLAGFGGQGILFTGKFLAYTGLLKGQQVSWLPSYGPEMRGGTANCSVILSDSRIGSPIVSVPDILMCMNLPSLDKFEESIVSGGILFSDSSLIERKCERTDITIYEIPATQMASDAGIPTLANMVLLGHMIKKADLCDMSVVESVLQKIIPERKKDLAGANLKALNMGYAYN